MIVCEICRVKAKVIIIRFGKNLCLNCLRGKYPIEAEKFEAQFKEKLVKFGEDKK